MQQRITAKRAAHEAQWGKIFHDPSFRGGMVEVVDPKNHVLYLGEVVKLDMDLPEFSIRLGHVYRNRGKGWKFYKKGIDASTIGDVNPLGEFLRQVALGAPSIPRVQKLPGGKCKIQAHEPGIVLTFFSRRASAPLRGMLRSAVSTAA